MKKIVLVEPICTGSRLLFISEFIKSVSPEFEVTILTRKNCKTEFFDEVMKSLIYNLILVDVDLDGLSMRSLSIPELRQYMRALILYDRNSEDLYTLIFTALDDYLFSFMFNLNISLLLRKASRRLAIKYRVGSLLHPFLSLKNFILNLSIHISCFMWRMPLIVFDERLMGRRVGFRKVRWIPDLWCGDFGLFDKSVALEKYGYNKSDFVALLIGGMDRRKGGDFLLKALPIVFNEIPEFNFCLFGKVSLEYQERFTFLSAEFPDKIKHFPNYLTEEELPLPYAMSSVVLLPYHSSFSSTSGVLPRAAASKRPVIASSHELVGFRVDKYDLGEIFEYGCIDQFIDSVRRVMARSIDVNFGVEFSEKSSIGSFGECLNEIMRDCI